jgi:hypothetical protein
VKAKKIVEQAVFPDAPMPKATSQPASVQSPIPQSTPQSSTPVGPPGPAIALLRPKKGIMEQLMKEKPLSKVVQELVPAYIMTCVQGQETFRLVVDRMDGCIVTSIDSYTRKRLPDLKHLPKEELKLLQEAYTAKLPPDSAHLADPHVRALIEKGYLLQEQDGIALSDKFLFQKLSKVKSDDDLEMTRVPGAVALAPVLGEGEVRMMLAAFVAVKQATECWVLRIKVG